jgi:hypothetical protein
MASYVVLDRPIAASNVNRHVSVSNVTLDRPVAASNVILDRPVVASSVLYRP